MPGFDAATGMFAVPIWAAGAAAALFVVVCVMAFSRAGQSGTHGTILRYGTVLIGALVVFVFLDRAEVRERAAERRVLDARAAELTARAIAPGSALACLDAAAGDTVESFCEKALFASPETVAAAVSYVAARLKLLADGLAYAKSRDPTYEEVLAHMRHAVAYDRFGIVAHLLASREGCNAENCAAFALIGDARRIKANFQHDRYASLIARHVSAWTAAEEKTAPVASVPTGSVPTASVLPNLNFPSASSIPPVSIMNVEPPRDPSAEPPTASTASSAPDKAAVAPPAKPPPRRPARRTTQNNGNPAKPAPAAPMALTPPSTAFDASAPTRAQ